MKWQDHRKEFDTMVEELKDLLYNKGKEYASDDNALANFNEATDLGLRPEQQVAIFLHKHYKSIRSYVKNDGKIFSNEPIEGRINDAINYLFLLRCVIKDKQRIEEEKLRGEHGVHS